MARQLATCPGSGSAPILSKTADRGRCPTCGRQTAINTGGTLRTHGRYVDADTGVPA